MVRMSLGGVSLVVDGEETQEPAVEAFSNPMYEVTESNLSLGVSKK